MVIRYSYVVVCFFKQKTAYEMRISDWSSDVCSSDLIGDPAALGRIGGKTLLYIVVVTTAAVTIGLIVVNVIRPGEGLPADVVQPLIAQAAERSANIASKRESTSMMGMPIGRASCRARVCQYV